MALNKKERQTLQDILYSIEKAETYIKKNDLIIAHEMTITCLPEHTYKNSNGKTICEVNKEIGSNICYLYNAVRNLKRFLIPPQVIKDFEEVN